MQSGMWTIFLSVATLALLPLSAMARLDFNLSSSVACAPLNVTFTPEANGFPYIVWVSSFFSAAQSYRINSDYQRDANGQITFQYQVPSQSNIFSSYAITVADSQGNANTSRPLAPNPPADASITCDPYTTGSSFLFASDSRVGTVNNMVQCGTVQFYTIDNRGTSPYTVTLVPIGGRPLTINIPSSATPSQTFFNYTTLVPFAEGTQFFVVLGDALGGVQGGTSPLYTVGASPSGDRSCLASSYVLPNLRTPAAVPLNGITATFANLAGAVSPDAGAGSGNGTDTSTGGGTGSSGGGSTGSGSSSGGSSSSSGTNTGAVVGGVIGGVIALAVVAAALLVFLLYKRRQRKRRDAARKEEDHFVDLDGDEDMEEASGGGFVRKRRQSAAIRQS